MGDAADMLLDGTCDEFTGEYLGPGPGYPRSRHRSKQIKTTKKDKMSVGGKHLEGARADVKFKGELHTNCKIVLCWGKRGKTRYLVEDQFKKQYTVRFSFMDNIRKE